MKGLWLRSLRGVGIVLLLLLVSACGAGVNPTATNATPTPLNPGLFPPDGTPQGPGQHTPVITPMADSSTSGPGANAANVNINATAMVPATTVAVNANGNTNTGEVFVPTATGQSLPVLGGNTAGNANASVNTSTNATNNTAANDTNGTTPNTNCPAPAGWLAYTVQNGDSLGVLAANTGISLNALATANCLTDADTILTGQVLYIPATGTGANTAGSTGTTGTTGNAAGNTGNTVASVPTVGAAAPANGAANAGNTTVNNTVSTANNSANMPVATGNLVGVVLFEPAVVQPGGDFQITSGTTVTLRALGVGNTATQFTFYLMPVDAAPGMQATILGTDTNIGDGITILWTVPTPNLRANIWAVANTGITTQPVVIVTK